MAWLLSSTVQISSFFLFFSFFLIYFNLKQNCTESIQWIHFNFHILDICAPVHSLMHINNAMSYKQRNLSILLAVLALALIGHYVKLELRIVRLFSPNSAILCFCLTVLKLSFWCQSNQVRFNSISIVLLSIHNSQMKEMFAFIYCVCTNRLPIFIWITVRILLVFIISFFWTNLNISICNNHNIFGIICVMHVDWMTGLHGEMTWSSRLNTNTSAIAT